MPLVKYRINENNINEILVDNNITVSKFMELVNKRSIENVTKSIFRGKILGNDDLIRNYITRPDYVLILLTNDYIESDDVMDLEQEITENEKQKEVKYSISSSFLFRTNDERQRNDSKYIFTVYTSATTDSMLHGNKIELSLNYKYQKVYEEIENLVSNLPQIDKNLDFDLHLFLSGGVHFKSGTLLEYLPIQKILRLITSMLLLPKKQQKITIQSMILLMNHAHVVMRKEMNFYLQFANHR